MDNVVLRPDGRSGRADGGGSSHVYWRLDGEDDVGKKAAGGGSSRQRKDRSSVTVVTVQFYGGEEGMDVLDLEC
jgi:hypothetical protein